MEPFEAVVLALLVALPFHLVVKHELKKLADPRYLRAQGVVVPSPDLLHDHGESIGTYMGQSIWGRVTFEGLTYRFDRVAPQGCRKRVASGELLLEPGLVYVSG